MLLSLTVTISAKTWAADFIDTYKDCKGARVINVKGAKLALARPFLSKRMIGPVMDHISAITLLTMQDASDEDREHFVNDIPSALEPYVYYGQWNSLDGTVDVYVMTEGSELVKELVVFNPGICTIYSLCGDFPVDSLLNLKQ